MHFSTSGPVSPAIAVADVELALLRGFERTAPTPEDL